MSFRHVVKNGFYRLQRQVARSRAKPAGSRPADRVVVFLLHTVNDARGDMAVSPVQFRRQMRALIEAGYRPLSMEELLDFTAGHKPSAPGFAITFDDGYHSVCTEALPILESLKIPAAVFLTTAFLDGAVAPPWRSSDPVLLEEYRSQAEYFRPMSWTTARELAAHPLISIGGHTVSHPLLGTLPPAAAREELACSRSVLGDRLGVAADLFAYPFGVRRYGAYSDTTEALLRETGYRCSLTSEIGRASKGQGSWSIPRISLTSEDSGADAVAKAAGAYDWVGTAQSLYQSVFSNPHKSPSA